MIDREVHFLSLLKLASIYLLGDQYMYGLGGIGFGVAGLVLADGLTGMVIPIFILFQNWEVSVLELGRYATLNKNVFYPEKLKEH
jgi:hypothetical protein